MTISIEKKIPLLHNFHSYLYEPDWRFTESKEKDRQVLEDFPTVVELEISSAYGYFITDDAMSAACIPVENS